MSEPTDSTVLTSSPLPQAQETPTASEIIKRLRRLSVDHQLNTHALDQELVRIELERLLARLTALAAEQERAKAELDGLVATVQHYLGPDWGTPPDGKQGSYVLASIHHLGGLKQDYVTVARAKEAAEQENRDLKAEPKNLDAHWAMEQIKAQCARVLAGDGRRNGDAKLLAQFVFDELEDLGKSLAWEKCPGCGVHHRRLPRTETAEAEQERLTQELQTLHDNVHKHLGIALSEDGNEAFIDGAGLIPLADVFVKPATIDLHRVKWEAAAADVTRLQALLRRAIPRHDATCAGACMDEEPENCSTLALIRDIEAALLPARVQTEDTPKD